PGADDFPRGAGEMIRLRGEVPLDVVEDRAPPGHVEGAPLQANQLIELGIVHAGRVEELAGKMKRGEVRVGEELAPADRGHHLLEPAEDAAGDESAHLLELQLALDSRVLPVPEGDLHRVHEVRAEACRRLDRRFEATGIARLGEEAFGLRDVVLVEPSSIRRELVDGDRPFGERRRNWGWALRARRRGQGPRGSPSSWWRAPSPAGPGRRGTAPGPASWPSRP